MPPVSTSSKKRPLCSRKCVTRSRVTPAWSSTIEIRRPQSQFSRLDLPTFGRPTMTTCGMAMTRRKGQAARHQGNASCRVLYDSQRSLGRVGLADPASTTALRSLNADAAVLVRSRPLNDRDAVLRTARRTLVQRLEGLHRAGILQIGKVP